MRVAAVALALMVAPALFLLDAGDIAAAPTINGWYPCHESTPSVSTMARAPVFECATVEAPLCHDGICESTKTVNLFVKRILARKPTKPCKALWTLQVESVLKNFNITTSSTVDMYTLDHRGTGRSNVFACQAAQAFSDGSPGGVEITVDEVPNCLRDLRIQMENKTEAFSVTSAAKDVVYLIDLLNGKDAEVYVYGASYGTYWGSRVMHLAPPQVKAYILDGVVDEKAPPFATWNENRRLPEARYLQLCEKDAFCSSKLANEIKAHGSLSAAVFALYDRLDAAAPGDNKCADLARTINSNLVPSYALRGFLGEKIQADPWRVVVPAILHRMYKCDEKDVAFLTKVINSAGKNTRRRRLVPANAQVAKDFVTSRSDLLGWLVKASEMYPKTSPSWSEARRSFGAGMFPTSIEWDYIFVCFMRANFSDPVCDAVVERFPDIDFTKQKLLPFVYKPDAYWRKYARIPTHASAMVINGGLDFQTPNEGGTTEYEGLVGGDKILVEFETGAHCAGIGLATASDRSFCGYSIMASFVLGGGNVSRVNTTCMKNLPAFDFADLNAIKWALNLTTVNSADELYDSKA